MLGTSSICARIFGQHTNIWKWLIGCQCVRYITKFKRLQRKHKNSYTSKCKHLWNGSKVLPLPISLDNSLLQNGSELNCIFFSLNYPLKQNKDQKNDPLPFCSKLSVFLFNKTAKLLNAKTVSICDLLTRIYRQKRGKYGLET